MRKKVDPKIQALLSNALSLNQRSVFVIIGDRGRDQVVNLHYLMIQLSLKRKPRVLWCYKKDLGFTTNQKKRERELKKKQQQQTLSQEDQNDPFSLFLSSQSIRYCYYAETQKILGNTFDLLVLQDFEALTPNTLCRTIETVQGGGIIVFLLRTMTSLKQLYSLSMDVHSRFRTHQFQDVQPRFNERFILSLSTLPVCLFLDDELNLLPVSSQTKEIEAVQQINQSQPELEKLQTSLKSGSNETVYQLVSLCKTIDQAKVVMMLVDALQEKIFRYTVTVTAARGRGKSSAIGLATAAAIILGFSNIFISAPNPENLNTYFEFLVKGLESLGLKENQHFDVVQSTNPDFANAVVRVNIYKTHRQFVQFVLPNDGEKAQAQADLFFVDEAAAIPLPFVKKMFGQFPLIMSSTVNGYEGTGRSLSLKLTQRLREQNIEKKTQERTEAHPQPRLLKELTMQDPIRYTQGDPVERWLYDLLLLDATEATKLQNGLPHPNECELFLVNRDTLFCYQKKSEKFLRNLMSLFISSHYKNSPNDLQLLSDAPAHAVFVLLGPLGTDKTQYPDILCVIQVCLEGQIPQNIIDKNAEKSLKPAGDLIPWTLGKFYLDDSFPQLSGARIVRIATHPNAQKMGYGSKSIELLKRFFENELVSPDFDTTQMVQFDFGSLKPSTDDSNEKKKIPPLLKRLGEVIPPQINYLGVSFGLTKEVYRFWVKNKFEPAYLSLKKNEITGEYSCILLKPLQQLANENLSFNLVQAFSKDFRLRFQTLLAYDFRDIDQFLALDILQPNITSQEIEHDENQLEIAEDKDIIKVDELMILFSLLDFQRLDSYCRNLSDFYLILDLLPNLCKLFFSKKTGKAVRMSKSQAAILVSMGLQHKSVETTSQDLIMDVNQILPLFNKAMRKLKTFIKTLYDSNNEKKLFNKDKIFQKIQQKQQNMNPIKGDIGSELKEEGKNVVSKLAGNQDKGKQRRGRTNFELDDIRDEIVDQAIGQQNGIVPDVVTLPRDKKATTVNYLPQKEKKIKK